jgi:DNA-binding beta-propeller fold protein YncE
MAYSQQENALWVATSQSRSLDKGGIVYRLDPTTLDVTQIIHNDLKPFGATINHATARCGLATPRQHRHRH